MTQRWNLRLGTPIAFLLLPVAIAGGLIATAPEPQEPRLTAFSPGGANMTRWTQELSNHGIEIQSIVAGTFQLGQLIHPERTVLVVFGLQHVLTTDETTQLMDFLAAGGAIWLGDSAGFTNPWVGLYGATVVPYPLIDSRQTTSGTVSLEAGINATMFSSVTATAPSSLLLQDQTAWTLWLRAPSAVHIDYDADGQISRDEPGGPLAVGAYKDFANGGRLIMNADSTHAGDEALATLNADNDEALQWVVERLLPGRTLFVFDEAHQGWNQRETGFAVTIRETNTLLYSTPAVPTLILVGISLAATGALWRTPRVLPLGPHQPHDDVVLPSEIEPEDARVPQVGRQLGPATSLGAAQPPHESGRGDAALNLSFQNKERPGVETK